MREDSEEVIISWIWDNHGKEVGYEQKGVLVRCKDCKYKERERCGLTRYTVREYDYCNYGVRKEHEIDS